MAETNIIESLHTWAMRVWNESHDVRTLVAQEKDAAGLNPYAPGYRPTSISDQTSVWQDIQMQHAWMGSIGATFTSGIVRLFTEPLIAFHKEAPFHKCFLLQPTVVHMQACERGYLQIEAEREKQRAMIKRLTEE